MLKIVMQSAVINLYLRCSWRRFWSLPWGRLLKGPTWRKMHYDVGPTWPSSWPVRLKKLTSGRLSA